ncbi:MAG: hypothetical protein GY757_21295 [bacterium]|nr:hypothetical protein [bacterium]
MSTQDHKEWLLNQIKAMSELLRDGRYDEIDLSSIEKEAAEMARNFGKVINTLETAGEDMNSHTTDLPLISEHLAHISKTTENGVMSVITSVENIMKDATQAQDALAGLKEKLAGNKELQDEVDGVNSFLGNMQSNSFCIISSLEFEDINRQVIEKILLRLNELYDNLLKILLMIKLKEGIEDKNSAFLESIKHIVDIGNNERQEQEMVDIFFDEFDL